jgi:CheY-like chemotaxis protein/predicted regulator of Ras-like GTPase activity (Roadblock/LC7/MglB family)
MMSKKHVLIVDDAKDIVFLLMQSLKRLGPEYEITTATNVVAALEQIQKQKFDLVLTDYMMPGMTGVDLAQAVRKISPDTQVVLMTAHDSRGMRDTIETLQLGGYVGKPFTVPEILEVVQRAIARTTQAVETDHPNAPALGLNQAVHQQLKTLRSKTGAHSVLLISTSGHPLRIVGETNRVKSSKLAAFVAANFLAVTELASLLGDNEAVFKSSYHEGSKYNIYAYDINGEFLLAVVFGTQGKPGTVWFYTKQTGVALADMLGQVAKNVAASDAENTTLANDFEGMFGPKKNSES